MLNANETEIKKGLNEGPFLFIVNPKSGTGAYLQFYRVIETIDIAGQTIIECKSQEHMISLARNAKNQGFDAYVAKLFDESPGRGFGNYIQLTLRSFQKYKPEPISINGVSTACFSLLVSNVNQLGNNAFINPLAFENDGYLEQISIQPPLMG